MCHLPRTAAQYLYKGLHRFPQVPEVSIGVGSIYSVYSVCCTVVLYMVCHCLVLILLSVLCKTLFSVDQCIFSHCGTMNQEYQSLIGPSGLSCQTTHRERKLITAPGSNSCVLQEITSHVSFYLSLSVSRPVSRNLIYEIYCSLVPLSGAMLPKMFIVWIQENIHLSHISNPQ